MSMSRLIIYFLRLGQDSAIMASSSASKPTTYPDPMVALPSLEHRQTFIMLHGRGSNAKDFAPQILFREIPDHKDLHTAFPNAKFIFPNASPRRSASHNRALIHQWFDHWTLDDPNHREELQVEGLRETSDYLHGLLRAETEIVGAKNVVLWSLSQGCAASLVALLTWEGEGIGAMLGMCGWLPFRQAMENAIEDTETKVSDPADGFEFAMDDDDETKENKASEQDPATAAVNALREIIGMPRLDQPSVPIRPVPIMLGHGTEDEKVPIKLGQDLYLLLDGMGVDVSFKKYEGLGHQYSGEMLRDMVDFVLENS